MSIVVHFNVFHFTKTTPFFQGLTLSWWNENCLEKSFIERADKYLIRKSEQHLEGVLNSMSKVIWPTWSAAFVYLHRLFLNIENLRKIFWITWSLWVYSVIIILTLYPLYEKNFCMGWHGSGPRNPNFCNLMHYHR